MVPAAFLVQHGHPQYAYFHLITEAGQSPHSDVNADFGNTVRITWDLPEGITATSASGKFLTQTEPTPPAVPEPATMALLGSGLLGLMTIKRRRAARARR